MISIHNGLSE